LQFINSVATIGEFSRHFLPRLQLLVRPSLLNISNVKTSLPKNGKM